MAKVITRKIQNAYKLFLLVWKEFKAIVKYNRGGNALTIMLLCHALEKGMGINDVKNGYGIEKANQLLILLSTTENITEYMYAEAYYVLVAYIEFQKNNGVDVFVLENKLNSYRLPLFLCEGGYSLIDQKDLLKGKEFDFKNFVDSKHSIRFFINSPIKKEEIEQAIMIASKAPSACNRQPWKVYYTLDQDKNKYIAKLVPGNKGFAGDIPYYAVITVEREMFSFGEAFQWYLNGGIFISYFTLAFHSLGIGSCIFQYPDFYSTFDEIRHFIKMKDSEVIAAIVGFGKYSANTKCICASRKPISEISQEF